MAGKLLVNKGLDYVKSIPGILKIIQIFSLLICIGCMTGFMANFNKSRGSWEFFIFSVIASCVISFLSLCFFTIGIHRRFESVNWWLVVGIIYVSLTIILIIAGSILADNARNYKEQGLCDAWKTANNIDCKNLVVSAIFSFIACLFFALDSIIHIWMSVICDNEFTTDDENEKINNEKVAA